MGGDITHAAGGGECGKTYRLALSMLELWRREPAEMLRSQDLTVAAVVLSPDDRRVEFAAIEGIEQDTGIVEAHFDRQPRIVSVEPCEQGRQFRPRDMRSYAERKAAAAGGQPGNSALMRG